VQLHFSSLTTEFVDWQGKYSEHILSEIRYTYLTGFYLKIVKEANDETLSWGCIDHSVTPAARQGARCHLSGTPTT
jgi:hypothetical protein